MPCPLGPRRYVPTQTTLLRAGTRHRACFSLRPGLQGPTTLHGPEGLTVSRPCRQELLPSGVWNFQPCWAVGAHVTSPQEKPWAPGTAELPWRTALLARYLSSSLKELRPPPPTVGLPREGLLAAHACSLLDCTPCTSSLCWFRFVSFCWNKSEPQVRSHAESCEPSKQIPEMGWPCGDPTQAPQNPRQTVLGAHRG